MIPPNLHLFIVQLRLIKTGNISVEVGRCESHKAIPQKARGPHLQLWPLPGSKAVIHSCQHPSHLTCPRPCSAYSPQPLPSLALPKAGKDTIIFSATGLSLGILLRSSLSNTSQTHYHIPPILNLQSLKPSLVNQPMTVRSFPSYLDRCNSILSSLSSHSPPSMLHPPDYYKLFISNANLNKKLPA